jgi:hypothetical protein
MLRNAQQLVLSSDLGGLVRVSLHAPRSRKRSIAAAALGALVLLGSLLVAMPAHALNDTGAGGVFVPSTGRILDTRNNIGGYSTPMPAKTWRTVTVAGNAGVPDDGSAGAVSVVATVANISTQGQLFGRPNADEPTTMMGIYGGENAQNTSFSAVLAVNADGTIQVQTETTARLILDVQGYYTSNNDGTAPGGFVPLNGKRIVDTRSGLGATKATVASGERIDVQVTGNADVPAGASGVIVNLIAVNTTDSTGYLTPYATGSTRPANSFNYAGSVSTSMQAQVQLSSSGKITVYNANSTTNIVIDVQGYFTAAGTGGAVFTPGAGRIYDTRTGTRTALAKNETRSIQVAGVAGVPVMGSGINAVVLTLTALKSTVGAGNATVWADGTARPNTTSINFDETTIRTNTVTVPPGSNGKISLANVADATDYVIDVQGWYINPVAPTISCPSPYSSGTWTQVVPADDVICTVSMPNTGDADGVITTNVNDGDSTESAMSGTAATSVSVTVPAIAGWYVIDAESSYSNGDGGESTYGFGIEDGAPSAAVAAIQNADPTEFEGVAQVATTATGQIAVQTTDEATGATGTISTNPGTGITVATTGDATDVDTGSVSSAPTSLQLALPTTAQTSTARVEATGVVSYDNGDGSTTVPIAKLDGSVQINTVLATSAAPARYSYTATVPSGTSLALSPDGGVVATDAQGNIGGSISPAWAIDAEGNAVPTHYEIDGQTITQLLDLSSSSISYPVVADPWAGSSYVKKLKWENVS